MTATIVTALYDIGREENGDGRSFDQYLEWILATLQLNAKFVLYTDHKIKKILTNRSSLSNVKFVIQPLDEIPCFKYRDKIEQIIRSEHYRRNVKDSRRIECNLALYNCVQYSKFEWILDAIQSNFYQTEYYFWMDAGCSRFFDTVKIERAWPSMLKLQSNEKFIIQGNCNTLNYNNNWPGENLYIWDNNCIVVGTLFGGCKNVCTKIGNLVQQKFLYFLDKNIVNNEQIILGILQKEYPDLFDIFINLNGKHLPLFAELSI